MNEPTTLSTGAEIINVLAEVVHLRNSEKLDDFLNHYGHSDLKLLLRSLAYAWVGGEDYAAEQ